MPATSEPMPANSALHAYLDGELDARAAAAVELTLATDVETRVLAKSMTIQRDALRAAFRLPLECPTTHRMIAAVLSA